MTTLSTNTTSNASATSFLHEFQIEGKGSGKLAIENWETAMSSVNRITNDEILGKYRSINWEQHSPERMAIYCQDCQKIVPPEMKTIRKKMRAVCGACGSKKISSGRESVLRQFYRIEDSEKVELEKV